MRTADEADGVIASRRLPAFEPRPRQRGRSLASAGFAWGVRRLFDLPYADTQCGAKVVHRHLAERAVPLMSSRDFVFDVDLLLVARRLDFHVIETPTVWIDQHGSKLRAGRDSWRMLASALRLWIHRVMPVPPHAPTSHRPTASPTVTVPVRPGSARPSRDDAADVAAA
jgi:hypothetical protein